MEGRHLVKDVDEKPNRALLGLVESEIQKLITEVKIHMQGKNSSEYAI